MSSGTSNEEIVEDLQDAIEAGSYSVDDEGDIEIETQRAQLEGELADRVRQAFNEPVGTPAYIVEVKVNGGTETTREIDYFFELHCGIQYRTFEASHVQEWGLNALLKWLDQNAPV